MSSVPENGTRGNKNGTDGFAGSFGATSDVRDGGTGETAKGGTVIGLKAAVAAGGGAADGAAAEISAAGDDGCAAGDGRDAGFACGSGATSPVKNGGIGEIAGGGRIAGLAAIAAGGDTAGGAAAGVDDGGGACNARDVGFAGSSDAISTVEGAEAGLSDGGARTNQIAAPLPAKNMAANTANSGRTRRLPLWATLIRSRMSGASTASASSPVVSTIRLTAALTCAAVTQGACSNLARKTERPVSCWCFCTSPAECSNNAPTASSATGGP